jgi:type IV secretion system protein VirB2
LESPLEVTMSRLKPLTKVAAKKFQSQSKLAASALSIVAILLLAPTFAHAQGTPFDNGFTALQNIFTGTIAKVASLIAIVIGGYQFAHGEPGSKKTLAGIAAGTGIAVLATNVLSWLWGV